ncbi:MAG: hypothetical protein ACE5SW_07415 [Nitrososphaeraceae archaeon]
MTICIPSSCKRLSTVRAKPFWNFQSNIGIYGIIDIKTLPKSNSELLYLIYSPLKILLHYCEAFKTKIKQP